MHTTLSWRRHCAIMLALAFLAGRARVEAAYFQGFDNVGAITNNSDPLKWAWINNSVNPNTDVSNGGWGQGDPSASGFNAQAGPNNSFAYANFNSTQTAGQPISNWFISPTFDFVSGDTFSFWTRTVTSSTYPDSLDIDVSANGTSTNVGTSATSVGDFTNNALTINSSLAAGGYPETWTQYTINITSAFTGRIGFRYNIPDTNNAGNYVAIDSVQTSANLYVPVPEPTTYALAGISTVLLAGLHRRKSNRKS